ncbi:MAG TPA: hypothetical protein VFE02_14225 [Candidatus Acidoferrales bacterium]|nr:hypothetical protein [Candidatus Acidoferrales bacterium]
MKTDELRLKQPVDHCVSAIAVGARPAVPLQPHHPFRANAAIDVPADR